MPREHNAFSLGLWSEWDETSCMCKGDCSNPRASIFEQIFFGKPSLVKNEGDTKEPLRLNLWRCITSVLNF